MKCDNAINSLDGYLDGELVPSEEAAISEHLAKCEACDTLFRQQRRLLEQAALLAEPVTPPPEMWDNIAAQIDPQRHKSGTGVWAAAAAAVFGVAAVLALSVWQPGPGPATSAEQEFIARSVPGVENRTRARLVSKVSPEGLAYSPKTEAVLRKNIQVIQQAIEEIEAAIEEDPNNPDLRELLMTIYQQESELVDNANRLQVQAAEGLGI